MALTARDIIVMMNTRGRGSPPSAIADLFVNPLVKVLNFLDTKGDLASIEQTVDDIVFTLGSTTELAALATALGETQAVIIDSLQTALEGIASNFGLTRRGATSSRGTVLLYTTSAPTVNIQVLAGKRVSAPSLNQDYSITETTLIPPSAMVYDTDLGAYTYPVTIESVNTGVATAAAAEQITKIKDGIANISGVINTQPVVGGRDEESDANLAQRTKTALSSNNIGTQSGYRLLILGQDEVKDAVVIGAGDPLMTRDLGDGGSIDIYVANAIPVSVTETTTITNSVGAVFTPTRQPIIDDASVVIVTGFSPDPTYTYVTKDSTVYAGSIRAKDTITFDISIPIGTATITYQVNDLVSREQTYIDDTSRKILGADILLKEAINTLVDIIIRIVVLSGYNGSTVKANVENAVTQHISAFNIGQSLEQSDVIKIITEVEGVDRVDLPLIKFDKSVNAGIVNVITAAANEILKPGAIQANL